MTQRAAFSARRTIPTIRLENLSKTYRPARVAARQVVYPGVAWHSAPSKTWIKVKNPKAVREAVELRRMKKKLQAKVDGR
jgi:hypothetical protein